MLALRSPPRRHTLERVVHDRLRFHSVPRAAQDPSCYRARNAHQPANFIALALIGTAVLLLALALVSYLRTRRTTGAGHAKRVSSPAVWTATPVGSTGHRPPCGEAVPLSVRQVLTVRRGIITSAPAEMPFRSAIALRAGRGRRIPRWPRSSLTSGGVCATAWICRQ